MGYVKDIRALVGHRRIVLAGTGVLVEDEQGRVLLQRRADNGMWASSGGAVEIGEDLEHAARREVLEETGLRLGALELFAAYSGEDTCFTYPNGDEAFIVGIYFICREWQGDLKADPAEVSDLCFFALDDMPSLEQISPPDRRLLAQYMERKRQDI